MLYARAAFIIGRDKGVSTHFSDEADCQRAIVPARMFASSSTTQHNTTQHVTSKQSSKVSVAPLENGLLVVHSRTFRGSSHFRSVRHSSAPSARAPTSASCGGRLHRCVAAKHKGRERVCVCVCVCVCSVQRLLGVEESAHF